MPRAARSHLVYPHWRREQRSVPVNDDLLTYAPDLTARPAKKPVPAPPVMTSLVNEPPKVLFNPMPSYTPNDPRLREP
jgi:hypothetical protein